MRHSLKLVFFTALVAMLPAFAETDFGDVTGLSLLERHHYSQAVACYDRFLQKKPDNAGALLGRGEAWLGLGDIDAAVIDLSRSISIKPQAETYAARGDARLMQHNATAAMQDYKSAVRLDGNDNRYLSKLGTLYYELHDYQNSRMIWRKAVALEPKNATLCTEFALATRKCDNDEECLALAQKAVELDPKQYAAWKLIAMLEFKKKHYQKTISAGKRSMLGYPHDTSIARWVIESYIATKDYEDAQALIQRLSLDVDVRKDSGEYYLYFLRAETYEAMGKNDLALRDYGHAIASSKDNSEAHRCRGRLLKKMGRAADATTDENASLEPVKRALDRAGLHHI